MSYILDSSAIFRAIKDNLVEIISGNYTLELARYELGNILWKQYTLNKRFSKEELKNLIQLAKDVLNLMDTLEISCHEEEILNVAEQLQLTFYDASYVYHAKQKMLPLITEDLTLINKAKPYVQASKLDNIL